MSLGLEGAKPFAIEGAFSALRNWSPVRALALAALGIVAVAYSLTAELSLMAATRADNAAQRAQASTVASAAKARYDAAQREFSALPISRAGAVLDAEIARLRMTPKLASCDDTTARAFGPVSRRVCAEIATLNAEAGTTARRSELQTILTAAEHDIASAPLTTDADPAATALAVYLAAIRVPSDAGTLSKWLALIPVLALEVGSAFAVILAGGTVPATVTGRKLPAKTPAAPASAVEADPALSASLATPDESSAPRPLYSPATGTLSDLGKALIEHVRDRGGIVRGGQRGLAKALGSSTSELHRTIHALAAAGAIAVSAAPTGTELRIIA